MEWNVKFALGFYGVMCLTCGVCALLLPIETKGREMAVRRNNNFTDGYLKFFRYIDATILNAILVYCIANSLKLLGHPVL